MATRVVCVKLTDAEFALCREMSTFGRYLSVSDVLRAGLVMLAGDRKLGKSAIELAQAERNDHEPRARPGGRLPGTDGGRGKILPAAKHTITQQQPQDKTGCPKRRSKCKTVQPCHDRLHDPLAESLSPASDSAASPGLFGRGKILPARKHAHGTSGVKATSRSRGSARRSKT